MKNFVILIKLSIIFILALNCSTVLAADGTWNVDANGNWSTSANWASGTIADGAGSTANFTYNITTNRTVTVDSARTIGKINFGSAASVTGIFWTLGSGTLTLDNSGSTPVIDVATTVLRGEISSLLAGSSGFNKTGNNTLRISGNNGISGDVTVSSGILSTYNSDSLKNADVVVSGGILDIGNGVNLSAKSLTVSGSGQIQARANNTTANINVPMSIGKEGAIYTENNVQGVTLNINSNVTMTANAGFELGGITNTLNINKPITGAYDLKLKGNSDSSLHNVHFNLNATNSYTGKTYLEAWSCSSTFDLNAHHCLPSTTELHFDVYTGSGTNSMHLDLNDYTQQVTKLVMNSGSGTYIELMGNENGVIIGKLSASGQLIFLSGGTLIANDEVYIGAPVTLTNAVFINNYR
jgi:autotransporter-associated beta strand protein